MNAARCSNCPVRADLVCQAGVFCSWAADPPSPLHLRIVIAAAEGRIVSAGVAVPCPDPPPPADPLSSIPLAGDVVAALAARIGAARLAAWWARRTGRPCGCAERRERLNAATRALIRWAGLGR